MTEADLLEVFDCSMRVCGADPRARDGALRNFGQALTSGVLRGDEFRYMLEHNPYFMSRVAHHMGLTIGALRAHSQERGIEATTLCQVLEKDAEAIRANAAAIPTAYGDGAELIEALRRLKATIAAQLDGLLRR